MVSRPPCAAPGTVVGMRAIGIDHIVFTVSDVEKTATWWRDQLGAEIEQLDEWRAGQALFVSARLSPTTIIDIMVGERTGSNVDHVAVLVHDADLDEIAKGDELDVETGPLNLSGAQGSGRGVYVRDPDGNRVELRTY